jgi:hypothetical protein
MTSEERDTRIIRYFDEDLALLRAKGRDYAGSQDCLLNLRLFGVLGIIVRLSDKFSRLETLTKAAGMGKPEPAVKDEGIIDTLRDIRNYAYLAQIFIEGEEGGESEKGPGPVMLTSEALWRTRAR